MPTDTNVTIFKPKNGFFAHYENQLQSKIQSKPTAPSNGKIKYSTH